MNVLSENVSNQRLNLSQVKPNILVISSHAESSRLIQKGLDQSGYQITLADTAFNGYSIVLQKTLDLIILDWPLMGLSAIEFCQYIRSNAYKMPIIVLTEEGQMGDRIACLDAGADDCLVKPIHCEELAAKLRAHLRRMGYSRSEKLIYADLVLDLLAKDATRSGHYISLTAREFDLLEYFMRHPKQVVTRTQILNRVWGEDFVGFSNVIEVYVRSLRRKLEECHSKRLIHTIRGSGYILRE